MPFVNYTCCAACLVGHLFKMNYLQGSWKVEWTQSRAAVLGLGSRDVGRLGYGAFPACRAEVMRARQVLDFHTGRVHHHSDMVLDCGIEASLCVSGNLLSLDNNPYALEFEFDSAFLHIQQPVPVWMSDYVDETMHVCQRESSITLGVSGPDKNRRIVRTPFGLALLMRCA